MERVDIEAPDGTAASVIAFGASLMRFRAPGPAGPRPVVLGFARPADYPSQTAHLGAIAGRVANRVAHGRFTLDGRTHALDRNENARHHLHGGTRGFGCRDWSLRALGPDAVRAALVSPHGDMGYPGEARVGVTYRLRAPATLAIEMEARVDAPCPVNLAAHPYFNLADAGASRIDDHRLWIAAARYTPADAQAIPTGAIAPVAGTPYDFRAPRPVGTAALDANLVLDKAPGAFDRAARLESPAGDLALEVWTDRPGLQLYTGDHLATPPVGPGGRAFAPRAGLCLEPQHFPDSPNRPAFPSCTLRPGEVYRQRTELRVYSRRT